VRGDAREVDPLMSRACVGPVLAAALTGVSCSTARVSPAEELDPSAVTVERRVEIAPSIVSTSADGDDGSRYVAGVFSGTLFLDGVSLRSHGGDDIFVARLGPRGRALWAHAVGSPYDEASPKVSFEDGHVTLVGMTGGAVDCGQGPLGTWSSETFFVCTFDPRGEPLNGGAFPTGRVGSPSRSAPGREGPALE
jgi:hypothetical protein